MSGLKIGLVVTLGSIIGGGLLAVGLLSLPSSPENKLNEVNRKPKYFTASILTDLKNSYAELRQEQIDNFHKFNPTTLPPVYTKTPDETSDSENEKVGLQIDECKSEILIGQFHAII